MRLKAKLARRRLLVAALLAVVFTGSFGAGAYAAKITSYSTVGLTALHGGQKWQVRSWIQTGGVVRKVWAQTEAKPQSFTSAQGVLGAHPRMYHANGALAIDGVTFFVVGSVGTSSFVGFGVGADPAAGTYLFSKGIVYIIDGSTTYAYTTSKSGDLPSP